MSKEILMAETAVVEAEAPVQVSKGETFAPADAPDTAAGVERFLQEARNRGPHDDPDPSNTPPPGRAEQGTPADAGGAAAGGVGGRGGDGGGNGPEGPRGPELPNNSLEYESNPERGRQIAEEIVKWEALRVAGRINEVNWPRLNQLYREQRIHTVAQRKVELRVKILEDQPPPSTTPDIQTVNPDRFIGFNSLEQWTNEYTAGTVSDMPRFIREVNVYFEEAKRVGLLKDLDAVLASAYNRDVLGGIRQNITSVDVISGNRRAGIEGIDQKIQSALNSLMDIYRDRQWRDPEITRLARIDPTGRLAGGVWDLYVQFAMGRFVAAINNRDMDGITQRPYAIDNEFHLEQGGDEDAPQETFWRTSYGPYVEFSAQTKEQFIIAADTWLSRQEKIQAAPAELIQKADQFIENLQNSEGAKKLPEEVIETLILGIQARLGVFGADQANELYDAARYKQFMDYINKDGKGPARWLELSKLLDGQVAADLWALDKDPRWEILFSLFGSRGQLANSSQAQRNGNSPQGLFYQARDIFIEEMLGVAIKDKRHIDSNLTRFMPDKEFTNMYDGLYRYGKVPQGRSSGDVHIRAYQEQLQNPKPDKELTPDERRSIRLGKIQVELQDIREQIRNGNRVLKVGQTARDVIKDESDRKFYQKAWAEASKAFDIAFQIYGALGEKSKRAGGVFKVNRADAAGNEYQDFVPIHYAEKFVQFAETMTKMQYADSPARERTVRVREARDRAIAELKKNGFEAKLYNADGTVMKLKRPKEDLSKEDELARDARGNVIVEEKAVDFYTATHHPYGDWTSHTYWSYQEEDRHMVLAPETFAQARKIRAGEIRPEDADPWAIQLLILDPTLKRVRRFDKNFEDRERKLTMAAVEDSYQSHWRIGRELYRSFFPKYGTPAKEISIYYGLQDYGGFRKMIEHSRARAAEDPERFARRGRRLIPDLHIPAAALSEIWGQGSVGSLGVIRMLGAPIYRMGGTFALDKFAAQSEFAGLLYDALFISKKDNEGILVEPLLLKLTNESDKLSAVTAEIPDLGKKWDSPSTQNKVCYALMDSLGREKRVLQLLVTMESLIRNATGAQFLEEVDVLTNNGQLNPAVARRFAALPDISRDDLTREDLDKFITEAEAIEEMSEEEFNNKFNINEIDEGTISANTGSGRHSAKIFHNAFGELLIDQEKRGGVQLYPGEKFPYSRIKDKIIIVNPQGRGQPVETADTIWDFIFGKFVPT